MTVDASRPVFGDLYGPGHDIAAVNVWCSGAHGTAADQLENSWVLFTDNGGTVQPLTTLLPRQPSFDRTGVHVPYFDSSRGGIVIAPGSITVHELWYRPKNSTCCPSQHVTTVWREHGTSFSPYTAITD